jgi:hypothetical protein
MSPLPRSSGFQPVAAQQVLKSGFDFDRAKTQETLKRLKRRKSWGKQHAQGVEHDGLQMRLAWRLQC